VAVVAQGIDGEALPPGHWVLVVSPVNMDDGVKLMWHPPQPVTFNLIEAKRYGDRGVASRRSIMGNLTARPDGGYEPLNGHAALDCLSDLSAAILFAFTAIESLANHAIDMLPDGASLTRKGKAVAKDDMVRGLGVDDKLKRVMPMVEGGMHIAATATWGRYLKLKFLRDELLHVKERGYDPDPDERTAYDRLMVGEGDECVAHAVEVVQGAWPGFLPSHVLEALDVSRAVSRTAEN
jgi:hypothetical protein